MTHPPSVDVAAAFHTTYGHDPSGVWSAPGRVNLIGEHTDYNRGLCLPIAIPRRTYVAASPRQDSQVRIVSRQVKGARTIDLDEVVAGNRGGWAAYAVGVLWALREAGHDVRGLDVVVDGRVPLGSGLSSSAALECATAVAADEVFDLGLSGDTGRVALAQACIRAENEIAGAPTGGMDQSASLLAAEGHALLLDFDAESVSAGEGPGHRPVPFDLDAAGLRVLVMNTRASHSLSDGQYGSRRDECDEAVARLRPLGFDSLRAVTLASLDQAESAVGDAMLARRVRHIVTEIDRVRQSVEAIRRGEFAALGTIFDASHASMRDDFEISCRELDVAVESARDAGALAARMTGGGFGGSAIALVPTSEVDQITAAVESAFADEGLREPELFAVTADGPARREMT